MILNAKLFAGHEGSPCTVNCANKHAEDKAVWGGRSSLFTMMSCSSLSLRCLTIITQAEVFKKSINNFLIKICRSEKKYEFC
jgi:hypothetical protein